MSVQNFKAFVDALKADPQLQATLRERLQDNNDPARLLALAKETGFSFELDELETIEPQSISDDQLTALSGGAAGSGLPKAVLGVHKGI